MLEPAMYPTSLDSWVDRAACTTASCGCSVVATSLSKVRMDLHGANNAKPANPLPRPIFCGVDHSLAPLLARCSHSKIGSKDSLGPRPWASESDPDAAVDANLSYLFNVIRSIIIPPGVLQGIAGEVISSARMLHCYF